VPALRQAGVPVGIGTDGSASNDSQNMLEAVKTAALLQKVARLDPRALTAGDVLAMATVGARALGLERRIGSLEPGKRATWSGCGATAPAWPTSTTPASRSSTAPRRPTWPTSGSNGARRVAGGQLVDHDLAALVEASRPLAAELVALAGLGGRSRLA
jgi:cytosine/adenosine deaminase-related metal-dependent hydrolase